MKTGKGSIALKVVKIIVIVVLALGLGYLAILGVLTIAEYKPAATESIAVEGSNSKILKQGDDITVVSWNTGYCGLDAGADFFMDGGTHVMSSDKKQVETNLSAIISQVKELDPDAVFFQEVDLDSKRSHHINEQDALVEGLEGYQNTFAYNYKVLYVPYPFPCIGKVDCGLVSMSKYEVTEAERVSLPCPFGWPSRVGNLKRCLLINRVAIEGTDKELVLVNLHLEAYDSGEGKAAQTAQLIGLLQEEVDKGNYVIAAGDFNQTFSNVDKSGVPIVSEEMWIPGDIDVTDFGADFSLLMDETSPSCRSLDKAYTGADKDNFQYYIIDGFIVSNNLEIDSMETLNLDFANSDHNPIVLKATLN